MDVSVIRKTDGSLRVFGHSLTFDRNVADGLARAAVAVGECQHEHQ
jgi:hypothetical protein